MGPQDSMDPFHRVMRIKFLRKIPSLLEIPNLGIAL